MSLGADTRAGRAGPAICVPTGFSKNYDARDAKLDFVDGAFVTMTASGMPAIAPAEISLTSGKWYLEFLIKDDRHHQIGALVRSKYTLESSSSTVGQHAASWGHSGNHSFFASKKTPVPNPAFTKDDVIGLLIDLDHFVLTWTRNGEFVESALLSGEHAGSFVPGDALVPAWGSQMNGTVAWHFNREQWRFAPEGVEPLQAHPYPAWLAADVKAPAEGTDALSNSFSVLAEAVPRMANGTGTEFTKKRVESIADARPKNTGLQSGLVYHLGQIGGSFANDSAKGFKGTGIDLKGDNFRDGADAVNKTTNYLTFVRGCAQRLLLIDAIFPNSAGVAELLKPLVDKVVAGLPSIEEAVGNAIILSCYEERRLHKFCDYGMPYFIKNTLPKILQKNDDAEKAAAGENLRVWRKWMLSRYIGPAICLELALAAINAAIIDTLGSDPDEAEVAAAVRIAAGGPAAGEFEGGAGAISVPSTPEDPAVHAKLLAGQGEALAELIKEVTKLMDNGDKERDRFPDRCEDKYRQVKAKIDPIEAKAERYAATLAGNGGRVNKALIASCGIGSLVGTAEYNNFMAAYKPRYHGWAAWHSQFLINRTVDWGMCDILRNMNSAKSDAFHCRTDSALTTLSKCVKDLALLQEEPGYWTADTVTQHLAKFDDYRSYILTETRKVVARQQASQLRPQISSAVTSMEKCLSVNDFNAALSHFRVAQETLATLRNNSEWSDITDVQEMITKFTPHVDAFMPQYKATFGAKKSSEAKRDVTDAIGSARLAISHHDLDQAATHLARAKQLVDGIKGDDVICDTPVTLEFLPQFDEDFAELHRVVARHRTDKKAKAAAHEIRTEITHTKSAFDHNVFDKALGGVHKIRSLANALESDEELAGNPEAEAVLAEVDAFVPEFTEKYKATMTARQLAQAMREAKDHLSSANTALSHSNYEASLTSIKRFREQVAEIDSCELYQSQTATAADAAAFVEEARNVSLPAWKSEYETRVVAKHASSIVREINSMFTTAQRALEQSNFDGYLTARSTLKAKLASFAAFTDDDVSDDALAVRSVTVQEAINGVSGSLASLDAEYDAVVTKRLIAEGKRSAEAALNSAKLALDHHNYDAVLVSLREARNLATDFSLRPEGASDEGAAFVSEFEPRCKAVADAYTVAVRAKAVAATRREITDFVGAAKQAIEHYRNDEALVKAAVARTAIAGFKSSYAGEPLNEAWESDLDKVEADYADRVLSKLASELIGKANSQITSARLAIEHSNPDAALSALHTSRTAAAEVASEPRIAAMPAVVAFNNEFPAQLKAVSDLVAAFDRKKRAAAGARDLSGHITTAEGHLFHSRYDAVLVSCSRAAELKQDLELDDELAAEPALAPVLAEADGKIAAVREKYRAQHGALQLTRGIREVKDILASVRTAIDQSNYDAALTGLATARDRVGALAADPVFDGSSELDSFIAEFRTETQSFGKVISEKRAEAAKRAAEREVSDALGAAQLAFDHNQGDRALTELAKARAAVAALEGEHGASDFSRSQSAAIADIEAKYVEKAFKQEVDRKIARADLTLKRSKDALEHNCINESLALLKEANDAAAVLGGDARFVSTPVVSEFCTRFTAESRAHREAIIAHQRSRAQAELERTVNDQLKQMEHLSSHHRNDEALIVLRNLETLVDGELTAPGFEVLRESTVARTSAFRKEYQATHLAKSVAAIIRGVNAHFTTAEFNLEHNRHNDALTALRDAQTAAAALNGSEYEGMDSVNEFFASWSTRVTALKARVQDVLLAKSARDAMGAVTAALSAAEQCLNQHNHDFALVKLADAGKAIAAIKEEANLAALPSIVAFLAEAEPRKTALGGKIASVVFAREVKSVVRSAESAFERSKQLASRFAYDEAMSQLHAAKAAVSQAAENEALAAAPEFVEFKTRFTAETAAFSKELATTALEGSARDVAREVSAALAQAKLFTERVVEDKAAAALADARAAARPFYSKDDLLSLSPVAAESCKAIEEAQRTFTNAFLLDTADKSLTEAKKALTAAKLAESRMVPAEQLFSAAVVAASPFLGESKEAPVSPAYAVLPGIVSFVTTELIPAVSAAGIPAFASASSAVGGSRAGGKVTFDSMLGERFPGGDVLQKNMVRLQKGPDLDPKFFRHADKSDVAYKRAASGYRDIMQGIRSVDLRTEEEGLSTCESAISAYAEILKSMRGDKDCVDTEEYNKMKESYENFNAAWQKANAQFERRVELFKIVKKINAQLTDIVAIPNAVKANGRWSPFSPYRKMEYHDLFLNAIRDAVSLRSRVQNYGEKVYHGFVNQKEMENTVAKLIPTFCKLHIETVMPLVSNAVHDMDLGLVQRYVGRLASFPLTRQFVWDRFERMRTLIVDPWVPKQKQYEMMKEAMRLDGSKPDDIIVEDPEWFKAVEDQFVVRAGTHVNDLEAVKNGSGIVFVDEHIPSTVDSPLEFKASSLLAMSKQPLLCVLTPARPFNKFITATNANGEPIGDTSTSVCYYVGVTLRINGEVIEGSDPRARALGLFDIDEAKHMGMMSAGQYVCNTPDSFKLPIVRYNSKADGKFNLRNFDSSLGPVLAALPSGKKYTFEIDLISIRVPYTRSIAAFEGSPIWPSEPSVPLASAKFILNKDADMPLAGACLFPICDDDAARFSKVILEHMCSVSARAHPNRKTKGLVQIAGGAYVFEWESYLKSHVLPLVYFKRPYRYARDFVLYTVLTNAEGDEPEEVNQIAAFTMFVYSWPAKQGAEDMALVDKTEHFAGFSAAVNYKLIPVDNFNEEELIAILGPDRKIRRNRA